MNDKTGWKTAEVARHYARIGNSMIPGRTEIMDIIGRLPSALSPVNGFILDLGCGYGDATDAVLQKAPDTSAVLIDFSDEMIGRAKERFKDNPKTELIKYDLNEGIPDTFGDESFDAVVSCFALHHVEFERRLPLYTRVCSVLKSGGIFINGDRFAEESPHINEWMFNTWVKWMTDRVRERLGVSKTFEQMKARQIESDQDLGDKPGSLWAMEKDLRTAGFSNVDCLYKNQIIAIIAAIK